MVRLGRKSIPADESDLFGIHEDYKRKFTADKNEWKASELRTMSIMGTAKWTDVWPDWDHVGKDFRLKGTRSEPLDQAQINMMNKYCDVSVTKFEKWLGGGDYGDVYKVKYQRRRVKTIPTTGQPSTSN